MQLTLAQAIQGREVELTVIPLRQTANSSLPEDLKRLGVRVVPFPSKGLLNLVHLSRLSHFLRQERFDVIHTHLTYANIIGTLAGRIAGISVIASLRTAGYDTSYHNPMRRQLETWMLRYGAKRVMAVGYTVADTHRQRLHGKRIDVIPNSVIPIPPLPPIEREALRSELVGRLSYPLLISVGRLSLPKGYPDLITAFSIVREQYPESALLIAGEGALRADLVAQIKILNLENHIVLLGARDDVPRLLAASDLYISSSHWEGLPVSVLEAMAAGRPVIATRVGDVPHVVVDGAGLIVPPREPATLAATICALLANPAQMRSLGQAAQTYVAQKHSLNAWMDQLLALYTSVYISTSNTPKSKTHVRAQAQEEVP
ncbi:MAG: glycosyltransferase [Chloroflexi bacterium]|nr:glycosyltransferase [Chloroflexota bacterium]